MDLLFGGYRESTTQKSLIENCVNNHKSCRPKHATFFLPTRLIDLRSYPKIRLVQGLMKEEIEDLRYVALSYCWGSTQPEHGKTTTVNVQARQEGINMEELPKTPRDAVDFAYSHGIPFLWVDMLCILQDDKADWDREASMMGLVYSRAFITVAASVSDHCDGGFMKTEYSQDELPKPRRGGYGLNYDLTQATEPNPWLESFMQNPLFSRGWTFQERELSPGIIHYTKTHVVWECREVVCSYIRPLHFWSTLQIRPLDLSHWASAYPFRLFDTRNSMKSSLATISDQIDFQSWYQFVESYSRRSFSMPGDKMPAIAGVADRMKERLNCDYLAGIWSDDLMNGLLWRRIGRQYTHELLDHSQYYAPSWSWMWTNFPISFKVRATATDAQVIEASVTMRDMAGPVKVGFLRLRTRIALVTPKSATLVIDTRGRESGMFSVCILKTCDAIEAEWGGREGQQLVRQPYSGGGIGLILQPVEDSPSTYRRIGYAELVPFSAFQRSEYEVINII